jgi:hypothetical protein
MTTVNGIDIATMGACILRGGDSDLLAYPARKSVEKNDWHEQDGLEADLTEVRFESRTVTVQFGIYGASGNDMLNNLNGLMALLNVEPTIILRIGEWYREFALRYVSCSQYAHRGGLWKPGAKSGRLSVTFAMDNPLQLFSMDNSAPVGGRALPATGVLLNGVDLNAFEIIVEQCYNTVLLPEAVKPPLTRKLRNVSGDIVYPSNTTTYQSKQVVVDCVMQAATATQFFNNYDALFTNLISTEPLALSTAMFDNVQCYYVQQQNLVKLRPLSNRPLVRFSLVFQLLAVDYYDNRLITEQLDNVITTETDKSIII